MQLTRQVEMSLADTRPGKFDYGPPRCDGHRAIPGAARAVRTLAGRIRFGNEVPEVTRLRYETRALLRTEHCALRGFDRRMHSGRLIRFARGWDRSGLSAPQHISGVTRWSTRACHAGEFGMVYVSGRGR